MSRRITHVYIIHNDSRDYQSAEYIERIFTNLEAAKRYVTSCYKDYMAKVVFERTQNLWEAHLEDPYSRICSTMSIVKRRLSK